MLSRRTMLRTLGLGAPAAAAAAVLPDVPLYRADAEQMERSQRLVTASYIDAIEAEMGDITAGRMIVSGVNKPIDEISSLDGSLTISFKSGAFDIRA
ncbi:hypothetical protein FO470_04975 [Starkeya sp. 3C]|uniref:Uncharacterized protein n=1 Tax=Ancylobacter moscoviensis TaxID=2597768 RepID=A0ABY3DWR3_9HYPH|nr:hypothetical protein [Ancylobacter moscoviensis]TSJ64614.1 hypothetical protein FO470_04975 [Ancylobacter moscoviensis]